MRNAIVFDFDGTLIDTMDVKKKIYADAFIEEFGVDPDKRQIITETQERLSGAPRFRQLAETLKEFALTATKEQVNSWNQRYQRYNDELTPLCNEFPLVREMLEALSHSFDLYLASGLPTADLKADAARRDLAKYFLDIRGGDKAQFCRELLQQGRKRMLFVGDGSYDRMAAQEADVPFVLVKGNEDLKRLMTKLTNDHFPPADL